MTRKAAATLTVLVLLFVTTAPATAGGHDGKRHTKVEKRHTSKP